MSKQIIINNCKECPYNKYDYRISKKMYCQCLINIEQNSSMIIPETVFETPNTGILDNCPLDNAREISKIIKLTKEVNNAAILIGDCASTDYKNDRSDLFADLHNTYLHLREYIKSDFEPTIIKTIHDKQFPKEINNEISPIQKNISGDKCPECGAPEIECNNPWTKYACGSSDYDDRPGSFIKGDNCPLPNKE